MFQDTIREIFLKGRQGGDIQVSAWVRSKRVSKNLAFLTLNDGSCQTSLQAVVEANNPCFEKLDQIQTGASLKVSGTLKESLGKGQHLELLVANFDILGTTTPSYPLQKKGHSLEFLREVAHLRGRTNTYGAVFRLRNTLSQGVHKYFSERGFLWAQTPIITASDCEGAGELFRVTALEKEKLAKISKDPKAWEDDFFGKPSFLTVSGQLQAEILALSHGKVYTFGPTFRAENSNTARHLAEFWMIEPEMAFCDLKQDCAVAEDFTRYLIRYALDHCEEELQFFEKFYKKTSIAELEKIATSNFEHISYMDAITLLKDSKKDFEFPVAWGKDLQTEHERYLAEVVFKKPITVSDYPKEIKSFYMRLNDDNKTVAAMDLLVPRVGELIGGSQREERYDVLEQRMDEAGVSKDELWWYLDLRRQGTVEHAGFGLGFERLIMFISGMQNIRDVILCPRSPKSINF